MNSFFEDISLIRDAKSHCISPENRTGAKGMAAMDEEGAGAACARDLGRGWKISPFIRIAPGETAVLADIDGPGRIQSFWITGSVARDYILRIYWDGQAVPSMETPLSDFFGYGWHDHQNKIKMEFAPINSAVMAVNPCYGFMSYWPMPFRKHCRITMENRNDTPAQYYYSINYELAEVPENAAYFHAQWRRMTVPYAEEYVILDGVRGRGHYAGVMLHAGMNGPNLWWGEGEVKFFLDGDREFPSIAYTGTEDYFGGAWGWSVNDRYTPYSTQYVGVHQIHEPGGGEDMQQRFAMYRWHVPDPIRFESDIKVTIQDLGWRRNGKFYLARQDDFATVAYWYQTLPTAPFPELPDRNAMEVV